MTMEDDLHGIRLPKPRPEAYGLGRGTLNLTKICFLALVPRVHPVISHDVKLFPAVDPVPDRLHLPLADVAVNVAGLEHPDGRVAERQKPPESANWQSLVEVALAWQISHVAQIHVIVVAVEAAHSLSQVAVRFAHVVVDAHSENTIMDPLTLPGPGFLAGNQLYER